MSKSLPTVSTTKRRTWCSTFQYSHADNFVPDTVAVSRLYRRYAVGTAVDACLKQLMLENGEHSESRTADDVFTLDSRDRTLLAYPWV